MKCQRVVDETWQIMDLLGIDRQRLHLKWVSASEGNIFAQEIRSFTERLRGLGKNPLAEKEGEPAPAAEPSATGGTSNLSQIASG